MTKDKKILYVISAIFLALMLSTLFIPTVYGSILTASMLIPIALLVYFCLKKRNTLSIERKTVLLLTTVIGLLFVVIHYLTAIPFGVKYSIGLRGIFTHTIPITAIIVLTEFIRRIIVAQEDKLANLICYFACILTEVLAVYNFSQIQSFYQFMDALGMFLIPAFIANFVYNYLSKRFGAMPVISYRLLITLYPYLFSAVSAMPDAILAFTKLVVPILMYLFISVLFEKRRDKALKRTSKWTYVGLGAVGVLLVSFIMLISCQFKYGMIVIATESMTGEINKGDAVIYSEYDGDVIEEGHIIVFKKDQSQIVHRVIKVEKIDGQNRYYTKGDANDSPDVGFITESEIIGVVQFKFAYLGYPTIWIRDMFA